MMMMMIIPAIRKSVSTWEGTTFVKPDFFFYDGPHQYSFGREEEEDDDDEE